MLRMISIAHFALCRELSLMIKGRGGRHNWLMLHLTFGGALWDCIPFMNGRHAVVSR